MIVGLEPSHRAGLLRLLKSTVEFTPDEVDVALELIDLGLGGSSDYRFCVHVDGAGEPDGYICFGNTPMTSGTYDLYWIAVDASKKGSGIGRKLVAEAEGLMKAEGGRLVRVETSGNDAYDSTRIFYDRLGYEIVARIRDFYDRGNDLVIYGHYF